MIWQILYSLPRAAISIFGLVWAIRGRRHHPRISWGVGAVCVVDLAAAVLWLLTFRDRLFGGGFGWTCLHWLKILVLVSAVFAERDDSPPAPAHPHEP